MYQVTINITPWNPKRPFAKFKSFTHSGVFIPKGKNCQERRIRKQVSRRLLETYQKNSPELKFRTSAKIHRIPNDFIIKEQ